MNQAVNVQSLVRARPYDGALDALDEDALHQLFLGARTHNAFKDQAVSHALLERAVELAKMGPTAANSSPFRLVFVETPEAKERLKPALHAGNLDKTMAAPVTAILAYDLAFFEHMPKLFPHADARSWYVGNEALAEATAKQSGTLQAGYFLLALRALGLDAGPMGGFDNAKVDAEFFANSKVRSNFLVNIGYGDHAKLFPRNPRLHLSEIASFA
jgi:3-hydroxypropanoate dehydrogenase